MSKNAPNLTRHTIHSQTLGPLLLTRALAQGTHGCLYHAVSLSDTSSQFAVKHIPNAHLPPQIRHLQYTEAEIQHALADVDNVAHMYEACAAEGEGNGWFLIMEYLENGDLYEWLLNREQKSGLLAEGEAKWLLLQLMDAMVDMHARGIYHRDLKPENVLIGSDEEGRIVLKITDFGMATRERFTSERGYGSLIYMPPEALDNATSKPSQTLLDVSKHDVWAMAQIALNLFLAISAWHTPTLADNCYAFFQRSPRTHLMRYLRVSTEFNSILAQCFQDTPQARPSMNELRDLVIQCEKFTVTEQEFEHRKNFWDWSKAETNTTTQILASAGFQDVEFDSGVDVEEEIKPEEEKEPSCPPWSPVKAARRLKSKIGAVMGRKSTHV
jgi:serine/threonine protein kinase